MALRIFEALGALENCKIDFCHMRYIIREDPRCNTREPADHTWAAAAAASG